MRLKTSVWQLYSFRKQINFISDPAQEAPVIRMSEISENPARKQGVWVEPLSKFQVPVKSMASHGAQHSTVWGWVYWFIVMKEDEVEKS